MKKLLLLLISLALIEISDAQVFREKTNASAANSNVKTVRAQQNNNQIVQKKTVATPNINPNKIIPLNSKSASYRNYVSNRSTQFTGSVNGPLFSKQYSFGDGTKMKISVLNPYSKVIISQSNLSNPKPRSTNTSQDGQNHCTTVNLSLSDNSNTFMNNNYAGQAPFIYPGAIYTYNNLFNGNFKEEIKGRNPVIITTDNKNMSGNSYEVVGNPDQASIQNAVTQMWQRFTTLPGSTSQQDFSQRIYEASTASDLAIKVGTDVSGYGGSFSGFLSTQKDQKTEYLTIDCIKPLFTISVAIPDTGYFTKNINVNPGDLVVIGSVTYGTRVLANIKSNFQSDADQADFSAGYSGWGVQAHADLSFFSGNSSIENTINAYYVGGPAGTKPSFDKSDLENEVTNFFANSNYQNAVPISYELYDLTNNHLSYISATDAFNIPLCVPNNLTGAVLDASANPTDPNATYAYLKTGNNSGDNKDPDTHWSFGIFDGDGNSVASFHDDSNNNPYSDGTTTGHLYAKTQMPATFGSFMPKGRIHINIAPKGNDTWNMDEFTLYLNFNNPVASQELTWSGINLSESKRDVDLTFHYDKTSNTLIADSY